MGLKKYEIITVGNDKRVRALRSWAVGDRYVNIGDVGGIVYDEKTLSQDGLCWLFRGNFGFPGARIGGDSIVDVAEAALSTTGTPAVDILGSSVVVGSKLQFALDQTSADAVVLTADDFEQGAFGTYVIGQPLTPIQSADYIRTKNPIFLGGRPLTVKIEVPGYSVGAVSVDRDGLVIAPVAAVTSGEGVTLKIAAGQYVHIRLGKNPTGPIVPADAATAAITFTGTYETKLSIVDSRFEVNPANATGTATIIPGGTYTMTAGAKYPEAIIRNSKVSMNVPAVSNSAIRFMGQIIGSTAILDGTAGNLRTAGLYSSIKNLTVSGVLDSGTGVSAYNIIQATDCNNFVVSPTVFPGLAAAQTANMPFIFQGCNVPNGRFYHHAKIANTYKNIDFALAQADLGKMTPGGPLVSSEVEGMYRLFRPDVAALGALVESYESVKSLTITAVQKSRGITIYKDAYLSGLFDMEGTLVFGHKVRSHPLAQVLNVQPRAVQGIVNTIVIGETITGVTASTTRVCVPIPFRVNGAKGLTVLTPPAGLRVSVFTADLNNVITSGTGWVTAETSLSSSTQLQSHFAFVLVSKVGDTAITPEDIAGVQIVVYNGCKIVNTSAGEGATAVNMKGNIRVEDNATLVNASVTGTGYFGGKCAMSGMAVNGCAYMKDNASIIKTAGSDPVRDLRMTENAYAVLGDFALNGRIHLSDNARFTPTAAGLSEGDLIMKDNAVISGAVTVGGILTMKDNAKVSAGTLTAYGDITVCGSFNQTVNKTWAGKRVIDTANEPEYDNNVKTQYDF